MQMDVWALGVCIYCWTFGHLPFVGQTILQTFEAIKEHELNFDDSVECSEELRDLLAKVRHHYDQTAQHKMLFWS